VGWIVQTLLSREVPAGSYDDVIRVLEWSPLAPRIVVEKLYAPGDGILGEEVLSGLENFDPEEFTPYPR
jgi:hypothetical protein